MKTAILAESPADESVARILAEAVLHRELSRTELNLRARGWPFVRDVLPSVLKQLHYHSDVELLLVVVDSDLSTSHAREHVRGESGDCRLCELARIATRAVTDLKPVRGRVRLRYAIGLAVPALEAWLACGVHPQVTEAAWLVARGEGRIAYRNAQLKKLVYGTERPSLDQEVEIATRESRRLASMISTLEQFFPGGFGSFADALRCLVKTPSASRFRGRILAKC